MKRRTTAKRRMQGRSRMAQNRMQDVKRATGAQVRGQLDDQDSQKTEIYGSRGRESALKCGMTAVRRM